MKCPTNLSCEQQNSELFQEQHETRVQQHETTIAQIVNPYQIPVQGDSENRSVSKITNNSQESGIIYLGKHGIFQQIKHFTGKENKQHRTKYT